MLVRLSWAARLAAVALLLLTFAGIAWPRQSGSSNASVAPVVALAELPPQAQSTIAAIRAGGPFSYERDGVVFGNFERLLPQRERGYYREYTVSTPGVTHRGARRIVAGRAGELYYTDDHYRSFRRIRE